MSSWDGFQSIADVCDAVAVLTVFQNYVDRAIEAGHSPPPPIKFYINVTTDATEYGRIKDTIESESAARGRFNQDYIAMPRTPPYHEPVKVVVRSVVEVRRAVQRYGTGFYTFIPGDLLHESSIVEAIQDASREANVYCEKGLPPHEDIEYDSDDFPSASKW